MGTTLTFSVTHPYGDQAGEGIGVPVELTVGGGHVRLIAKLDTGATYCIFQREYGEQLGLDIESGQFLRMGTVNGFFDTYGHPVTIQCFNWQFEATVYFAAMPNFSRNVLGRNGWINQFKLALIDHDSVLHLDHYNQP